MLKPNRMPKATTAANTDLAINKGPCHRRSPLTDEEAEITELASDGSVGAGDTGVAGADWPLGGLIESSGKDKVIPPGGWGSILCPNEADKTP
jgi:hypothetical protein